MWSFANLPDDAARLLRLEAAPGLPRLVPVQATLREGLNAPFDLVLEALGEAAPTGLRGVLGTPMTLRLKLADGSCRPWHGLVAEALCLGRCGPLLRWRLVLRPWLAWLALRHDSVVFQDQTALQVVQAVFAEHPAARWRVACDPATLATLTVHRLCMQLRESDFSFVARLLAREGLHWYFEHEMPGGRGPAWHGLVIADGDGAGPDLGALPFAAQHPTAFLPGLEDPVTDFMARHRASSSAVALGSWDPEQLGSGSAERHAASRPGALPRLQHYDGAGVARYADPAAAGRAAERALSALALGARRFEGLSGVRRLSAGCRFSLLGHPVHGTGEPACGRGDGRYTVLAVEHRVANNLGSDAARQLGRPEVEHGGYRNRFEAVPANAALVPRCPPRRTAPAALGARVVGLQGAALTSDRDHRVKVQFHFQRGRHPNPGGLPHGPGVDAEGHAPGDERCGAWLRVAGPAAGAGWGSVYVPRIGAEVGVQFLDGDADRPVVAGSLYHGAELPPFAAGCDSGMNHAGALSGLQSRRIDGGGLNQWVLDDSSGQLRMRLHASYAHSEFGLGHLIQQRSHDAWRGGWRGSGFEGGTQGWASVRAGAGLLLSTSARAGTYGSAQGSQMDAAEAIAQLRAARELGQRLGTAARAVQAPGLAGHGDGQTLARFIDAIDPARQGRHPGRADSPAALQAAADGPGPETPPVPAFAEPVALLDAASAALLASEASVSAHADAGCSVTAQGGVQLSAAATCALAGGGTAAVYAHQGGLAAQAAHGPVSLRAHADALRVLADQALTVVSSGDELRISAQQRVRLVAGNSALTLDGADIEVATPGAFTVKGAGHEFLGAGKYQTQFPVLPSASLEN